MNEKTKIKICLILLIFKLFVFSDYVAPIQWGQMKVSGLACTCPDERVINGKLYLRCITPDSLKQYDLDYSEIYVTESPSTHIDPTGTDNYIVIGKVIGKRRVSNLDRWNPLIQVQEWRELDVLLELFLRICVFIEIALIIFWWNKLSTMSEVELEN